MSHAAASAAAQIADRAELKDRIESAFEQRDTISTSTTGPVREAVNAALNAMDAGELRVAERGEDGTWQVNQWAKKAVLLSFRLNGNSVMPYQPGSGQPTSGQPGFGQPGSGLVPERVQGYDKVPLKFADWSEADFKQAGFRAVPGAFVRHSAYIARDVVLMPSFVNLGAYVDEGTMVDTWATVGSCAQIGKNVHISGGAGIGGVLEPLQAGPVIIEDNCFIGARSEVAEGVVVGEGAVLSMGVFIGASTKIIDRATGEVHMGRVPPYAVVVPGTQPGKPLADGSTRPGLYCAVIVKTVDAQTRSKTGINELLRD
ncbi:MAG: 2,3,4,5-tetrahydropyridine-2,6-dicarboxylate N-succinyltransferase [Pseudomonadota bacterium]